MTRATWPDYVASLPGHTVSSENSAAWAPDCGPDASDCTPQEKSEKLGLDGMLIASVDVRSLLLVDLRNVRMPDRAILLYCSRSIPFDLFADVKPGN